MKGNKMLTASEYETYQAARRERIAKLKGEAVELLAEVDSVTIPNLEAQLAEAKAALEVAEATATPQTFVGDGMAREYWEACQNLQYRLAQSLPRLDTLNPNSVVEVAEAKTKAAEILTELTEAWANLTAPSWDEYAAAVESDRLTRHARENELHEFWAAVRNANRALESARNIRNTIFKAIELSADSEWGAPAVQIGGGDTCYRLVSFQGDDVTLAAIDSGRTRKTEAWSLTPARYWG